MAESRRNCTSRSRRNRLTPEQRAQFARERKALVGKVLTQEGFKGALVQEHIRGSQYVLRMPDGTEVFASHKKQKGPKAGPVSQAGWRLWK